MLPRPGLSAAAVRHVTGALLVLALAGCPEPVQPPARFSIGGTVTGLDGTLVLQNNGGDDVTLTRDGAFTFPTDQDQGTTYAVTIKSAPASQRCTLSAGNGTLAGNVTNVAVRCASSTFTVSVTVTGLGGALVLQDNLRDDLTITTDGTATFATALGDGVGYLVSVKSQPAAQRCEVTRGTGTIAGANVTDVAVTCQARGYSVSGAVTGLSGLLALQNNLGDDLSVTSNGPFSFPTAVNSGDAYSVTVRRQPGGQTCIVTRGSGTVAADVTDIGIECITNAFTVSVTVTGLHGTLVLQNEGADDLAVTADGPATFATSVPDGSAYSVTVLSAPAGQSCTVTGGAGAISGANVTGIAVTCRDLFSIGGTVNGLNGTVVLQDNLGDDLTLTANGAFSFATKLLTGATYSVTVKTQPPIQTCTVTGGSGAASGNVTTVSVQCVTRTYTVGVTVTGLAGTLVLQNNGADNLTVTTNGGATFATALNDLSSYAVTVLSAPAGQACTVTSGTGTLNGANVTGVAVACRTAYSVGGTLSGLNGTVVLQNNLGNDLTLTTNGAFTFSTRLFVGDLYAVTVKTQPTGQVCTVTTGSGTMAAANVSSVTITCRSLYGIGGTLSGLNGTVVLQDNLGDDLTLTTNGAFTFATKLLAGATYAVTVKTQPAIQTCLVTNGAGTANANVTTVAVQCATNTYSVSVTVSGLTGTLVLQNNGADNLAVSTNGSTTFATRLNDLTPYAVTVLTQPANQTCTVTSGQGTLNGVNVAGISVTCRTAWSVGGTVSGLTGTLVLQNNAGNNLSVTTSGAFTFTTKLFGGDTYSVSVLTQPVNQSCTVTGGSGTIGSNVTTVQVTCTTTTKLLITEVGSTYFTTTNPRTLGSAWIEVRNISSVAVDLGTYQVRALGIDWVTPATPTGFATYTVPTLVVPPGGYAILRGWTDDDMYDGPRLAHIGGTLVPTWTANGFVELLNAAGQTEDFVRFGTSTEQPTTGSGWVGSGAAVALPFSAADLGKSLARDLGSSDTNTGADWTPRAFATFAGPNDAPCDTDGDFDGIPDCSEVPGSTFAGLPLYSWGARTAQKDIFMEIDWVDPNGKGTFDPGMQPRKESLDKVAAVFALQGYVVHFDTGALFDAAAGINPANWDLGGGNMLPYDPAKCGYTITKGVAPAAGVYSLYELKAANLEAARKSIFYYSLFANVQPTATGVDCAAAGSSGVSELPGNDFLVTMGSWGFTTNTASNTNSLINKQAATLMHEWGHSLGLKHGGFENRNFKPNYLSIMNYMYQLGGLPTVGHPSEGDRYYLRYKTQCGNTAFNGISTDTDLYRGPRGPTADFQLDYSHGGGANLVENALDETAGLGRPGSAPVDYDESGTIDLSSSAQVNVLFTSTTICGPWTPAATPPQTHSDFNDWAAVSIFGRRTLDGDRNGVGPGVVTPDPALHWSRLNDQAPELVFEEPPPPGLREQP